MRMRNVWEHARTMLLAAPRLETPGYTLLWTNGRDEGFHSLNAVSSHYAVIGRHSACDVVLGQDQTLSLRHILAKAIILEDKSVALRLLDLKAAVPFSLEDGEPRRSCVVHGPVLIRLGDYILGAVPHDPAEHTAHGCGPYRQPSRPRIVQSQRVPTCAGRKPGRQTLITILPAAPSLHEAAVSSIPNASDGQQITLSRGYETATVSLSDSALESGMLVGRAPRCVEGGLHSLLNLSVSRVHLLLLRDGTRDVAFDLCSTQGTFFMNRRVREVLLPQTGTTLTLAQNNPIDLWWHPRCS